MRMMKYIFFAFLLFPPLYIFSQSDSRIVPGADRFELYIDILEEKKVGLVVNHTSKVGTPYREAYLIDSLRHLGITVVKLFSPEHGLRGTADAGEEIKGGIDVPSGLPVISLYGDHKKPSKEDLAGLDIIVFDIQDVGCRFYTYISTLTLVMEACAEHGVSVMVLDRANPNGFYIDGPVLKAGFESFVGMHKVPVVYGMTIGEYAMMVNGEGWLKDSLKCKLTVIPCNNYAHYMIFKPLTPPSPNLKKLEAMLLYPSLCFFEGTDISVGRGTESPFQVIGHPTLRPVKECYFSFTPASLAGAKNPPHLGKECYGLDLRDLRRDFFQARKAIDLSPLLFMYTSFPDKAKFFNSYFDTLAGNSELRSQIMQGKTEDEIRASWVPDLEKFQEIRSKYLLYE